MAAIIRVQPSKASAQPADQDSTAPGSTQGPAKRQKTEEGPGIVASQPAPAPAPAEDQAQPVSLEGLLGAECDTGGVGGHEACWMLTVYG